MHVSWETTKKSPESEITKTIILTCDVAPEQGSTAHPDPARAEGIPASGRRPDAGCPPKPAYFRSFRWAQPASENGTHAGNPRKMAEPE